MEAERVLYQAGTRRVFQLYIGGTGVDFLKLNFSGTYVNWQPLDEQDGLVTARVAIESEYDAGITTLFSAILSNSLNALV